MAVATEVTHRPKPICRVRVLTWLLQFYFISRIPAVVALCFTKFSLLVFARRIFSGNFDHEKRCFSIAYATTALYGVGALVLSSAGYHPRLTLVSEIDAVCKGNVSLPSADDFLQSLTNIAGGEMEHHHHPGHYHRNDDCLHTRLVRLEGFYQEVEEAGRCIRLLIPARGCSVINRFDGDLPTLPLQK
jgi:hypothetical protein